MSDISRDINRRKISIGIFFMTIVTLAAIILIVYFYDRTATLAEERAALNATGVIEARKVNVSFKVPGRIAQILVDEGAMVTEGQELALLDNQEIQAKVVQAQGALTAAQGQAMQAQNAIVLTQASVDAKVHQAQAAVDKAAVGLNDAEQKYERAKSLHEGGALADSQMDEAVNNYNARQQDFNLAQGALQEAQAARLNLDVLRSQQTAASGQSQMASGALQEAEVYLNNTVLQAPIAGYITNKIMEVGEMVNAGTPVFEVTDLHNTYAAVFIDEQKIGRVFLGQKAEIKVDAYPDQVFAGEVTWINAAGQFAVKKALNERYSHDLRSFEVKVSVPNQDLKLKTGMTAEVKLLEEEHDRDSTK